MELFRLFGSVLIDDKSAIKALKQVDAKGYKTQKNMSKVFTTIGKAATKAGLAITATLGAALIGGIKNLSETNGKIAQMEAVLASTNGASGMTKESLLELASSFQLTTKFSADAALEAQNLLLTFTNIGSETFPRATKAAADMAQALGTDMSAQSIALGKALNDPIAGISALTRVGVTFTEEQKEMIKSLQEAGDMAGAQAIILEELEKEFGGSAEAAGQTFSGQLIILKNAFDEVFKKVAEKVMPKLESFTGWVTANMPQIEAFVVSLFDNISLAIDWLVENANWLIPVLAAVVGGFIAFSVITGVTKALDILKASTFAQTLAQNGLNAAMAANPIGIVVLAIGALIAIGVALWKNWDTVKEKMVAVWESVTDTWGNVKSWFNEHLVDPIKEIVDKVKGFFDFDLSLPKIKLPHFDVSYDTEGFWAEVGQFLGLPGKPVIGVDWYAQGGIFDKPTLFATPYGVKGVGEAGAEVAAPLDDLLGMIKKVVGEEPSILITGNTFNVREENDIRKTAEEIYSLILKKARLGGLSA